MKITVDVVFQKDNTLNSLENKIHILWSVFIYFQPDMLVIFEVII